MGRIRPDNGLWASGEVFENSSPVQRDLTVAMKAAGAAARDYHRMQVWAGQAVAMARPVPAGDLVVGM
jgi:hypothetical protein